MSESVNGSRASLGVKLALGFAAAVLAVPLFHQPVIALLSLMRGASPSIYNMNAVGPLQVPQIVNLMFWGGLWGVFYAAIEGRFPRLPPFVKGFLFGAIFPVIGGWFIVAPLKGQPIAAGWDISRMVWSPLINGMFGLGLGVIYAWLGKRAARG